MADVNSYKTILQRISAFGGVQVFNILLTLVRGKFVAMFLGPEGMGISSLLTSSTSSLQQFAGLGLNLAIVRETAACKDDPARLRHTLTVVMHLILFTSLLGALLCVVLSPWLSRWTFGNGDYTWSYIWLGSAVAFLIAGAGYLALLQGLGEVRRLSKASLVGGLAGLFGGVPLYWLFGVRGIVPAMILMALVMTAFYYISYKRSAPPASGPFLLKEHLPLVKRLISLGFILMIGSLAGTLVGYLINIFIRSYGSIDDVGLFQAANSLTNQYVGIIFSALALDYFPRLSAIASDNGAVREVVNRQTEIVVLIITPLIIALIATTPLLIRLLLTEEFLSIIPLMRWMGFGMLVQSIAFPLGYIYLAKADRRAYIAMEVIWTNAVWITSSILFYYLYSLIGLGISLAVRGIIDNTVNYLVCRRRYGFSYTRGVWGVMGICSLLCAAAFAASMAGGLVCDSVMWSVLVLSVILSALRLRHGLKSTR
ncbi:MAG: O-antigen translocase [Muribaculaceae bacterium]|nr:O-antigen translocase [Muribaculaceae bacterium]